MITIEKHNGGLSLSEALRESMSVSPEVKALDDRTAKGIKYYAWFWSLMLLLAVPFACVVSGEGLDVFSNLHLIFTSPSKLITDYFNIGSLGSAFLNAAICGLSCNIIIWATKAKPCATLLAGYFLVIAHCFYGLNIVNMWPPFLGVLLFGLVFKVRFGNILHIAMFSTSLSPFISDLLFRYTLDDGFVLGEPKTTLCGVLLSMSFGLLSGFLVPALLPGTTKMHRGFNLFKAGLAIGLFGMFAHALFYKTFGLSTPEPAVRFNPLYSNSGKEYILFADAFFCIVFALTLIIGFLQNGRSFSGYKKLFNCDGKNDDFTYKFGMPLTLINIGFYGFCVVAFFNLVFLLTGNIGYTGATVGVTIAAITFSASGQTPKNVWPIAFGYVLLGLTTYGIGLVCGNMPLWTCSPQGYINGVAFATGLCPFTGRYSRKVGIAAGVLHAILCTSTAAMHGGFVLYNGGLTSGLTALLLIPVLDFYKFKEKETEDGE